jgi:hypothetical protein
MHTRFPQARRLLKAKTAAAVLYTAARAPWRQGATAISITVAAAAISGTARWAMFESVGAAANPAGCAISIKIIGSHVLLIGHTHFLLDWLLFHLEATHRSTISDAAAGVHSLLLFVAPVRLPLCVFRV